MQSISKLIVTLTMLSAANAYSGAPTCAETSSFNWSDIKLDALVSKDTYAEVHIIRADGSKAEYILDYARADSNQSYSLLMMAGTAGQTISFSTGNSCLNNQAGITNVGVSF